MQTQTSAKALMDSYALKDSVNFDKVISKQFLSFGFGKKVDLQYQCIHHAIEEYVFMQPDVTAILHEGKSITYKELNTKADDLAYELVAQGVRPGDNVGLFLSRSIDLVVGILACLKVGAAYVPQDARIVPKSQLEFIKSQAQIDIILTLKRFENNLPKSKKIFIDKAQNFEHPFPRNFNVTETCFILFTSGTTGKPNGVKVTHKNLINILKTSPGNLGIQPGDIVSQILNISFDMSAWEILGCLSNGGTLLIRGKDIQAAVSKANIVISTPTILSSLNPKLCNELKKVAVAGEPCPEKVAINWSEKADFYNCCGPTETTIVNIMHHYKGEGHPISIGAPTPNNTVYILDENLHPLPIGEVGEMWAGGDCVTDGYVGNEKLTNERYRRDPFTGGIMFRTRDLGRWNKNGELEHFGRTDDQVKIRGFRVELDSVSSALESVPGVKRATTLKLNDRDLVGFVACDHFDLSKTLSVLKKKLQYYSIPAIILPMNKLPMTDRGKIDKKTLIQIAIKEYDSQKAEV